MTSLTQAEFSASKLGTVGLVVLKQIKDNKNRWIKGRVQNCKGSTNIALAYQGQAEDYGKYIFGAEI